MPLTLASQPPPVRALDVPVTVHPEQPEPSIDFSDLLELEDPIDIYSFLEGESRSGAELRR
jgi:hypothetical protein